MLKGYNLPAAISLSLLGHGMIPTSALSFLLVAFGFWVFACCMIDVAMKLHHHAVSETEPVQIWVSNLSDVAISYITGAIIIMGLLTVFATVAVMHEVITTPKVPPAWLIIISGLAFADCGAMSIAGWLYGEVLKSEIKAERKAKSANHAQAAS